MNTPLKHREEHSGRGEQTAVALIDGNLPIECEIGQRRQIDFGLITKAELTLLFSKELHAQGFHQEAFSWAVRASQEVFEALGGDRETQEPLKHLFFALQDLQKGTVDKALTPETVCNRKIFPSAEWNARACLAAALDARVTSGQTRDDAAEAIRKSFPITADSNNANRTRTVKLLIDWRKQFRRRTPPAGLPAWDGAQDIITAIQGQPSEWQRAQGFAVFEERVFDLAKMYRGRLASP